MKRPSPSPLPARPLELSPPEWVKKLGLKLLRNGWAFVVHLDPHAEGFRARGHRDRFGRIAVDERIADQIRKHLLEAVAIQKPNSGGHWT